MKINRRSILQGLTSAFGITVVDMAVCEEKITAAGSGDYLIIRAPYSCSDSDCVRILDEFQAAVPELKIVVVPKVINLPGKTLDPYSMCAYALRPLNYGSFEFQVVRGDAPPDERCFFLKP